MCLVMSQIKGVIGFVGDTVDSFFKTDKNFLLFTQDP